MLGILVETRPQCSCRRTDIRPNIYSIIMFYSEGVLACAVLLFTTLKLGVNPAVYFLKGLCFVWLEKTKLLKFTEADLTKDKRNKKHRTVSSEKEKESISFQTIFVKEESVSAVPFQFMFRLFFALFLTCVSLLLTAIIVLMTPLKDRADSFIAPAGLMFICMCFVAIILAFTARDRLRHILLPVLCGMSLGGVTTIFPLGPCDVSLILPGKSVTRIVSMAIGAFLGSMVFLTITRFGKMRKLINEPVPGLYQVDVMRRSLQRMQASVSSRVVFLHNLCPGNVFSYIALRWYFPKICWWYFDAGFWVIEMVAVFVAISVAKDCVQFWVFNETIPGIVNLNEKRTTKAVDAAIKRNLRSIDSICPTLVGFLIHPFVRIVMFLGYVMSFLLSGYAQAYTRIFSLAGVCAIDFLMAYFMFATWGEPRD